MTTLLTPAVVVALGLVSVVAGRVLQYHASFETYVHSYGKSYADDEERAVRYDLFVENLARIQEINARNERDGRSWKAGIGPFTDWSVDEWRTTRVSPQIGQKCSATAKLTRDSPPAPMASGGIPAEIDWRDFNVLTPVKNQRSCGSCWTFSTTGCLEAHHAIKTGTVVSLSEQNLVDCAMSFENNGCNGGLPSHAYEYIFYNGGIESEDDYPYLGITDTCHFDKSKVSVTVKGVHNITEGAEHEIEIAVGTVGPVSIAYDCADDFMHYSEGIYSSDTCAKTSDQVNHAVVAVGYGVSADGEPYWIVKNSWSTEWGEDGYFRIRRGHNECGLAQCASYPLV
ncbi:unnamed protein product (mitochondrion) [Plasmodiophora brassicae]|uniref:Peptidase C1A papain C-terminal domain-containing protein n=1 Tax=Plasmodiophora brassicae TaxID=37360 RepID=A0A0G4IRU2_PLABS|nr:hypothetical protein PBRA_006026 [Plasmodiophora brassicae]SPQ98128.1 unnamed protein product [Plasmodiophora brassicae]